MKVVDFPAMVKLFGGYGIGAEVVERALAREVEVLRALAHPSVVRLEEAVFDGKVLFLFMELVSGPSLLSLLRVGRLRLDAVKNFFFQLCSAVSYCHSNSVLLPSPSPLR